MDKFSLKFSCVVGRVQLAGAIWRLQLFLFKRCASVRADHDFDCRYDMSPPQSMAASGQRLNHPVQGSNFGMIGFPGISIDWDQLRQQVHGTLNRLGDFERGRFKSPNGWSW